MKSITQIGRRLTLDPTTIKYRFKKLGLYEYRKKYTEEEIDLVDYNAYSQIVKATGFTKTNNSKDRVRIVELFLSGGDNRTSVIAKKLNLGHSFVSETISDFLDKKYVLVESKMNAIYFCSK